MLIIVTTIPTAPTTVSIIYVPFVKFPIRITSDNTGSSQNVPILAKGEPLTVLAAPTFIIRYIGLFSYEFLRNKYTKFSILELAIFTDLDFVHFYQVSYYWYFQAVHSKKVPPEFSGGTFQTVDKTLLVSTPEAFFLFSVQKVCT